MCLRDRLHLDLHRIGVDRVDLVTNREVTDVLNPVRRQHLRIGGKAVPNALGSLVHLTFVLICEFNQILNKRRNKSFSVLGREEVTPLTVFTYRLGVVTPTNLATLTRCRVEDHLVLAVDVITIRLPLRQPLDWPRVDVRPNTRFAGNTDGLLDSRPRPIPVEELIEVDTERHHNTVLHLKREPLSTVVSPDDRLRTGVQRTNEVRVQRRQIKIRDIFVKATNRVEDEGTVIFVAVRLVASRERQPTFTRPTQHQRVDDVVVTGRCRLERRSRKRLECLVKPHLYQPHNRQRATDYKDKERENSNAENKHERAARHLSHTSESHTRKTINM